MHDDAIRTLARAHVLSRSSLLFPLSFFDLFALPPPRYPAIWACLGMVVGLYGLVYALAARHLERAAPLVGRAFIERGDLSRGLRVLE